MSEQRNLRKTRGQGGNGGSGSGSRIVRKAEDLSPLNLLLKVLSNQNGPAADKNNGNQGSAPPSTSK